MLLSVLLLQALWFIRSEQAKEAQRIVKQTLMIASPQEYRRPFLDEFPAIEPIVLQCRQVSPDFVDSLQVSLKDDREITGIDFRIEPLSMREQEVLQLAAGALTNREIADRLFISVGTVKWHMNHILAKLNVTSRSKAASRARELGLL
jgi:LuxR family maltose regulon positive regulatory protein